MSRSYPIWNTINSCAYRNSNKSYGVKEHSEITMHVGSSSTNSKIMATIKQTKKDFGIWRSFRLSVNGKVIEQLWYNTRSKKYQKQTPKTLVI